MAVKEENQLVSIILPKDLVAQLDKDAKKEERSRSKEIAKIIKDYYRNKKE